MEYNRLNPSVIVELRDNDRLFFVGGLEQFETNYVAFQSDTLDGKIQEIVELAKKCEWTVLFR